MGIENETMEEKPEETEHFRMRLDDLDEQIDGRAIPSEVNELRLEKISQRVTMISIMIPVLIVIVLVIAYLDIKKRVVQTEDSGTIEFRKLSSDLESRFSTLSLRQAKLEDTLEKLTAQNDHAMASTQVRMEKLHDAIEQIRKGALGVKELEAVKQDLVKQINGVIESTNSMIESTNSMIESTHEAGKQNTATLQDLKSQVIQQAERQAAMNTRIADAQKNYADLESRKIDKQSLDLALRLEALKVETAVKTQIDGLQQKLNALERQLSQLSSRATPGTPTPARPAPAPRAPTPAPAAPAAPSGTPSPSGNDLETHTITPR
jgi:chromosome segregation ATPase